LVGKRARRMNKGMMAMYRRARTHRMFPVPSSTAVLDQDVSDFDRVVGFVFE